MGLIIIIFTLILTSCQTQKDRPQQQISSDLEIGLSFDSLVIERWHREQEVIVSKAEELGAKVYVQNANGNIEKQIKQIEYLINKPVDAIIIIPVDSNAIAPITRKAIAQGIKVVAYDRLINNAKVDLCISFDNNKVGELLTLGVLNALQPGDKLLVIMGSPKDDNVAMIDQQFNQLVYRSKVNIIDKVYADNWRSEVAFHTVSRYLQQGEDIKAVFCGNDDLAEAAIKALSEYRKAGEVCVVGQDSDLSACQRIVEGSQSMTIYKDIRTLAEKAVEMTVKLIEGKPLELTTTINDGEYEVPYYCIEPIKVTKENIDQVIIESGFHLKEEVYLNLTQKEENE